MAIKAGEPRQTQIAAPAAPEPSSNPVVDAITRAATELGVPVQLALAIAQHESGLNPNAVGDNGTSFGLYQLHEGGELGNMTRQQAEDPYTNAKRALTEVAAVMKSHPGADYGTIAALAQRPANPAAYAKAVNQLLGSGNLDKPGAQVTAQGQKYADAIAQGQPAAQQAKPDTPQQTTADTLRGLIRTLALHFAPKYNLDPAAFESAMNDLATQMGQTAKQEQAAAPVSASPWDGVHSLMGSMTGQYQADQGPPADLAGLTGTADTTDRRGSGSQQTASTGAGQTQQPQGSGT